MRQMPKIELRLSTPLSLFPYPLSPSLLGPLFPPPSRLKALCLVMFGEYFPPQIGGGDGNIISLIYLLLK